MNVNKRYYVQVLIDGNWECILDTEIYKIDIKDTIEEANELMKGVEKLSSLPCRVREVVFKEGK